MGDEPEWFTLSELTERLAQLIWVAESMAEIFDGWTTVESRHRNVILFAEASGHHRWHGEILRRCLPTAEQLELEKRIIAPAHWQPATEAMRTLDAVDDAHIRLLVLAREIYPWLTREVGALLDIASPHSDGHVLRWLRFISIDHDGHRHRIAALLSDFDAESSRLSDRSVLAQVQLRHPRHSP